MDLLCYLQCIILAIIFLLFLYHLTKTSKALSNVTDTVKIVVELIFNLHKIHDKVAKVLEINKGTFSVCQMNTFVTSDPANVHHIMSANFSNYVKGSEWRKRFDIFGDHGIFNADLDEWKHQRKILRLFLSDQELQVHVAKIIPDIIEKELIPVLEQVSEQDSVVDLQDLFTRYTFDFASLISIGSNPNSLMCNRVTEIPFLKALDVACEVIFARNIMPEIFWRIQTWTGIGKERQYRDCWKIIDQFCSKHMSIKLEQLRCNEMAVNEDQEGFNALTGYFTRHDIIKQTPSPNLVRDNIASLIFATEDTTSTALSWFFWLLSKNPFAETKIREEIRRHIPQNEVKNWRPRQVEELSKLVYLHAAIFEALRLYPPVPVEWRKPLRPDTLPSGHQVNQKTGIFISTYAMGRMTSIWGDDCCEFKPERWITKDGGIKHEPSHKFFAFIAGPRICPGKDIGLNLMKAVIATVIHNYDVHVIEDHPVIPNLSIVLRMKHGLMARVKNRWV